MLKFDGLFFELQVSVDIWRLMILSWPISYFDMFVWLVHYLIIFQNLKVIGNIFQGGTFEWDF